MDANQAALNLQRAKQKTVHRSNFPKEAREKLLREKIQYYIQKMFDPATQNRQEFLQKAVEDRAKLFTLRIEDEMGHMTSDQNILQTEMKSYYTDCYKLSTSHEMLETLTVSTPLSP